jgi:opacity protein-like surface antigen
LERPVSVGIFIGVLNGSMLIDDWVGQQQGMVGGLRLGYDFNARIGGELRYAFGAVKLFDSERAIAAEQSNGASGADLEQSRYSDRDLVDVSALIYPWGDTPWRPYLLTGMGLAQVRFSDLFGNRYSTTTAEIPLGVGLKFHCTESTALRFEVNDTIIFSNACGFNTLHDLSVTGGLEFRFGGSRRAYWPWNTTPSNW